ncbi:MAG: hypothetical protein Q9227_000003 [Pyrenula ochraceoflavens]
MSLPAGEGWSELLNRKREEYLHQCGDFAIPSLGSRDDFTNELITAAENQYEPDVHRHLARLEKEYHRHVKKFAVAVGHSSGQITEGQLLALVWEISDFRWNPANRKVAIENNLPLDDIKNLLSKSEECFEKRKEEYAKLQEVAEQTAQWVQGQAAAAPQFEKLGDLGVGTFGAVHKVREISTSQIYAWKKIPAGSGMSQVSNTADVKEEMDILRKLSHHHIATLAFSTKDSHGFNLYILPVAEWSLDRYLALKLENQGQFNDRQIYRWFGCLTGALAYAHRSGVKHKDIKPANILVKIDKDGDRVLLTDFGLAMDFSDRSSGRTTGPRIVGTPRYLAPECNENDERDQAVDIFALGCVFAEILGFLLGFASDAFLHMREEWGGEAFRDSLEKVRDWLTNEEPKVSQNRKNYRRVSNETVKMLNEDSRMRPRAESLWNRFDHEDFRCKLCCLHGE